MIDIDTSEQATPAAGVTGTEGSGPENALRPVVLAAGGTGGHLFPAYALAQELGRRGVPVDLITDMRGDRYGTGFPARAVHRVPAATLTSKSPVAVAKTMLTLGRGVAAARSILGQINPGVVVGFGGYPSFPPIMAAKMRGVKTVLHEQNAVLGRANRLLASRVDAVATSFENVKYLEGALKEKSHFTGNPVRDNVLEAAKKPYMAPEEQAPINLLVFGGSQGARFFSDTIPAAVALLSDATKSRMRIIQQAREEDVERVEQAYAEAGLPAEVAPFFKDLPGLIAESHLVIARSGASTVAELTAIGRPSILVPLPHALDNDQLLNASSLAESGGAWCVAQGDASADWFAAEIGRLFETPDILAQAAAAAKANGRPDAVVRFADLVMSMGGVRA